MSRNLQLTLLAVSIFGQFIEFIGAILIYKFGIAKHMQRLTGAGIGGLDWGIQIKENKVYERWAKLGFRLIALGFVFQITPYFISFYIEFMKQEP